MVQNIGSHSGGSFVWFWNHNSHFGEGVGHAQDVPVVSVALQWPKQISMEANVGPCWDWQG